MKSGYKKKESYFFWLGFDLFSWFRVLSRYRFRVGLRQIPIALAITVVGAVQTLLRLAEHLIYGKKIARTEIADSPIFIIGHWRTGTTHLHELLALDPRFTCPTTYECFTPHHFLVSRRFVAPFIKLVLPARRMQDNMAIGLDHPQEDEFALGLLGVVSPYMNYAFPHQKAEYLDFYDLDRIDRREAQRWENAFVRFLKKVTFLRPKPLILKSPTHTFRIATLLRLFPGARFVYLVRNPYDVFVSTVHLWKSLANSLSLQSVDFTGLEDHVFEVFNLMHQKFEDTRSLIPGSQLCTVRFEDLEADPVGQMRILYESLNLDGFNSVVPALQKYLAGVADYRKNSYTLAPETHAEITRRWGPFIARYGYGSTRPG
jgi:hypothetical protein